MNAHMIRTPDAITTETKTQNNPLPRITYRYDLSYSERIILAQMAREFRSSMIGEFILAAMNTPDAGITITVSVPNLA